MSYWTDAPALGAIARHTCDNPDCLAEPGERHDPECTPDPTHPREDEPTTW